MLPRCLIWVNDPHRLSCMLQVNAKAAARMLAGQKRSAPEGEEAQATQPGLVDDPRFQAMFEREDFAIDEDAKEYRALHPNRGMQLLHKQKTIVYQSPCRQRVDYSPVITTSTSTATPNLVSHGGGRWLRS